jgi:hypothetical protein
MKYAILLIVIFLSGQVYSQDSTSVKHKAEQGNRAFGIGFNYTSPAPGLSVKVPITRRDHFQFSYSEKSFQWNYFGLVGWGYKWNFLSAEYQHRFDPILWLNKVQVVPMIYAGGGMGTINWNQNYLWYFGNGWEQKQDWYGYNLGAGVELFPAFFKNNLGFTFKAGLGSYATANALGFSANGGRLLWTGSVHYYLF